MAAPSFVEAGTGVVITTGNGTPTLTTASVVAGDLVVLHVCQDANAGTVTLGTITNIENLAGTDAAMTVLVDESFGTGTARHLIWLGRAIASNTATQVVVNTPGDDLYVRLYLFRGVDTGTTPTENDAATYGSGAGATAQINDTGVITNGADRLACQFVAINDDNAVDAFTGMTGGTWAEPAAEFASATGTDGCIQLQTASMPSAGTIDGGSYTMAAADAWGVIGFALKPVPGGVVVAVTGRTSASSFGTVTANSNINVAVTGRTSTSTFGTVTIVPGGITVAVTGRTSVSTFGAVAPLPGGITASVAGRTSTSTFGAVTVVPGNVNVALAGWTSTSTFGSVGAASSGGDGYYDETVMHRRRWR